MCSGPNPLWIYDPKTGKNRVSRNPTGTSKTGNPPTPAKGVTRPAIHGLPRPVIYLSLVPAISCAGQTVGYMGIYRRRSPKREAR
jgi:hypothetical protein